VAGGLAVAVTLALYAFGRAHVPDYTMGLLGHHGAAVNRLKAELATRVRGLALVQLTLALWMYRRLPGHEADQTPGASVRLTTEISLPAKPWRDH